MLTITLAKLNIHKLEDGKDNRGKSHWQRLDQKKTNQYLQPSPYLIATMYLSKCIHHDAREPQCIDISLFVVYRTANELIYLFVWVYLTATGLYVFVCLVYITATELIYVFVCLIYLTTTELIYVFVCLVYLTTTELSCMGLLHCH